MWYFEAKMHQISISAPDPAGELTALPQNPYVDLRGPTSKGNEGSGKGTGKGFLAMLLAGATKSLRCIKIPAWRVQEIKLRSEAQSFIFCNDIQR